jgi:hypothetical protein
MASKQFQVQLEINSHQSLGKEINCDIKNHDDCDWDTMIKEGLTKKFRELNVTKPVAEKNIIKFKVSFTNRSDVIASDIESKIDQFIGLEKNLVVKSLNIQ